MTVKLGVTHVVEREVVLTDEERAAYQKEMASLYAHRDKVKAELDAKRKLDKDRLAGMTARLGTLSEAIAKGQEKREMEVVWRRVPDDIGIAELIDRKTGRALERRPLEPDERQLTIDDFAPPPVEDAPVELAEADRAELQEAARSDEEAAAEDLELAEEEAEAEAEA